MTKKELIVFEEEIKEIFESGAIHGPVHLSRGNEDALIEIFQNIRHTDWVFSTWRSHYHALLHGISPHKLKRDIANGNSITLSYPEHNFYTSAIVGGITPIAVGVALAIKRQQKEAEQMVWCFVGDMGAMTGIFYESYRYAIFNDLPITFVIENNKYSTDVPTGYAWSHDPEWNNYKSFFPFNQGEWKDGKLYANKLIGYEYIREFPHQGSGAWINF